MGYATFKFLLYALKLVLIKLLAKFDRVCLNDYSSGHKFVINQIKDLVGLLILQSLGFDEIGHKFVARLGDHNLPATSRHALRL